ncbi:MAG: DUF2284 domain-containing protein [Acidobacteria bacterium]|nr:DUF2284 domain-containing protein [Acidobacteriota bacterium]
MRELALGSGARGAKLIAPATVVTAAWVRWKCQFGCDGYGTSRMCPPHAPTPEQTRSMLGGYRQALLFESTLGRTTAIAVALERELFLAGYYKAFGFGAGPCGLCRRCAFEDGCRHPEQARPAMEACGIDVFATARRHGFDIEVVRSRRAAQHYFGLVLVR